METLARCAFALVVASLIAASPTRAKAEADPLRLIFPDGFPSPTSATNAPNRATNVIPPVFGMGRSSFPLSSNECVVLVGGANTVAGANQGYLETLLIRRFPYRKVQYRHLGWDSDGPVDLDRVVANGELARHLREQATTAVFLDLGWNRWLTEARRHTNWLESTERLLGQIRTVTSRIVLLSPIHREKLKIDLAKPGDDHPGLELIGQAIGGLARRHSTPWVDLFRVRWPDPSEEGAVPFTEDGFRLSAYGHWRVACEIERALGLSPEDWQIDVSVTSNKSEASGTALSKIEIGPARVRFQAFDQFLPGPTFRKDESNVSVWRTRRLRIAGLAAGRYVLRIDGEPFYEKSNLVWEKGWPLTRGPEFDRVEALRAVIIEKNQCFSDYWRLKNDALTEREPGGGLSGPGETNLKPGASADAIRSALVKLSRKEAEIEKLASPGPHTYELIRKE